MFEGMTYEVILKSLLSYVPDELDKREGSIIYNALAPAAVKLAETYIDLDLIVEESFADTSSRYYLIKRCAERGIYPLPATRATVKLELVLEPGKTVPDDSRFSFQQWNFRTTEKIDETHYKAVCEETGPVYGKGDVTPIAFIDGLLTAKLVEILINGEDEEDTEALRVRYFNSFSAQAFGGNRADYKEKVPQLQDIGAIRVKRVTEQDKNVRLTIMNSTFDGASAELIRTTQESVDPTGTTGEGYGIAPIGHKVIVAGVTDKVVNIESEFTMQLGFTFDEVKASLESAVDEYYKELNQTWGDLPDGAGLIVRISQLETRFLEVEGVLDIMNTKLNGQAQNLQLGEAEIPKRGTLTDA